MNVPEEATPKMIDAVATVLQPYAAKLVWIRMLQAARSGDLTQQPERMTDPMDINARIVELARVRSDENQNEHNLAAMMRTLVDEVLTHTRDQLKSIRCDCGTAYLDTMKHKLWSPLGDRRP